MQPVYEECFLFCQSVFFSPEIFSYVQTPYCSSVFSLVLLHWVINNHIFFNTEKCFSSFYIRKHSSYSIPPFIGWVSFFDILTTKRCILRDHTWKASEKINDYYIKLEKKPHPPASSSVCFLVIFINEEPKVPT